jgi:hypothetical protein
MEQNPNSKIPRWIHNPHKGLKNISDLNIRVPGFKTVDLDKYVKDPVRLVRSFERGSLKEMLDEGELLWVNSDVPVQSKPKYTISSKPIQSKVFCVVNRGAEKEKLFVEALEDEWRHNPMQSSELENAKNTERLINSEEMDQFDDPSDRKW